MHTIIGTSVFFFTHTGKKKSKILPIAPEGRKKFRCFLVKFWKFYPNLKDFSFFLPIAKSKKKHWRWGSVTANWIFTCKWLHNGRGGLRRISTTLGRTPKLKLKTVKRILRMSFQKLEKQPEVPRNYTEDAAKAIARKTFQRVATKDKQAKREWECYTYIYRKM